MVRQGSQTCLDGEHGMMVLHVSAIAGELTCSGANSDSLSISFKPSV
jgi:hypothetical protein